MGKFRSGWQAHAIVVVFGFLGTGCAESDGKISTTADASVSALPPVADSVVAETDSDLYTAADTGIAIFQNLGDEPLYLSGCAPFVFEQSLDGAWAFVGPPFICVWEGFAVAIGTNEADVVEFMVPDESGIYRLRYDYGSNCEPDHPLSQANCLNEAIVYSNEFEVERELCDPAEFACRFVPAAAIFLCADDVNFSGPAGECTRDPVTGECGYEFLSCP